MSIAKDKLSDCETTKTLLIADNLTTKDCLLKIERKIEMLDAKIERKSDNALHIIDKRFNETQQSIDRNLSRLDSYMRDLDKRLWGIGMIIISSVLGYVVSHIISKIYT